MQHSPDYDGLQFEAFFGVPADFYAFGTPLPDGGPRSPFRQLPGQFGDRVRSFGQYVYRHGVIRLSRFWFGVQAPWETQTFRP